jgi:hypothetical protein
MRAVLIASALAVAGYLLAKAPKPANDCPDCRPAASLSCAQG